MDRPDYGKLLKDVREKRHWSQYTLAKLSGVTQATICSIETGKSTRINSKTRQKLAKAFKIPAEKLFPDPEDVLVIVRQNLDTRLKEYFKKYREPLNLDKLEDRTQFIKFLFQGRENVINA